MVLTIQGIPSCTNGWFRLDLLCGDNPNADIAFHFNPRLDAQHTVVMNSQVRGRWLHEIRTPCLPFQGGQPFHLSIKVEENCFKVFVDHREFWSFDHRLDVEEVKALEVSGAVTLCSVCT
ncbi:galectin-7-like [Ornithorhynchus anatinus]|uniref:Galectin n=1 Tax=Ornithorhynchus anatinus TaxID=9258 RepID=A0A6I8NGY3_ORNAN|nr:galectin-7-like [Ornithorhynchus anatinus]